MTWKRAALGAIVVGSALAAFTAVRREFRADSASYYAYLRSIVLDGDLDFTNEWEHWGYPEPQLTATGRRANASSVGPAVLWSPFFLAAHLYALAGGGTPDGYDAPYLTAVALGTLAVLLAGAFLLFELIARREGPGAAFLAVAGTLVASPVLYYVFVVPTMAHGVACGLAAALLWTWDRTRRRPSLGHWVLLGGTFGLLAACRWQAGVYLILPAAIAIEGLVRRTLRPAWLLAGAAAALAGFAPQAVAWKILYGRFLTVPQRPDLFDFSSPHLWDTLASANHGLFVWTPAMLLGALGLVVGARAEPLLHLSGFAVFAATAWVNGSLADWDWWGGDAFGARRFDIVVPLMAVGLGALLTSASRLLARRPLVAPAGLLILLGLWNVGFIAGFRRGKYEEMAPLAELARDQVARAQDAAAYLLGRLAGAPGRALVYKTFRAEYFYTAFNRSGTVNLWSADERYLLHGWGSRSRRTATPPYRRALYPEACVRIPLEAPFDLRVTLTARAPERVPSQMLSVTANGEVVHATALPAQWTEVELLVRAAHLQPGENALCLRFAAALPGEEPVAADVAVIQLP